MLQNIFRFCAFTLLASVFLLLVLELLLKITFDFHDAYLKPKPVNIYFPPEEQDKTYLSEKKLFYTSGAPVPSSKRSDFHLYYIDFHAYETADEIFVSKVLDDFYDLEELGLDYEPWSQFHTPFYDGEVVHVDLYKERYLVRRTLNPTVENQADKEELLVFAFGGSTTFGFLVADTQTWPSYLSKELNERLKRKGLSQKATVINFGNAFYNPSQEVMLLINLLRDGERPDVVIFMDGINGTGLSPGVLSSTLFKALRRVQHLNRIDSIEELLSGTYLMRFVKRTQHAFFKEKSSTYDFDHRFDQLHHSYIENMEIARAVCELYGCKVYNFIQPAVTLNYDLNLFRFEMEEDDIQNMISGEKKVYEKMRQDAKAIDLNHLYEIWGKDRKAFVDDGHYSPGFNDLIAKQVAKAISADKKIAAALSAQ